MTLNEHRTLAARVAFWVAYETRAKRADRLALTIEHGRVFLPYGGAL